MAHREQLAQNYVPARKAKAKTPGNPGCFMQPKEAWYDLCGKIHACENINGKIRENIVEQNE